MTTATTQGLRRALRLANACLLIALLAACSSNPPRPTVYTVKRGDTLYSIAWRHRLDYEQLARWNDIGRDYVIQPGQQLRLYPRSTGSSAPVRAPTPPAPAHSVVPQAARVAWVWPVAPGASAQLTTRPNGGQGLTIAGALGDEIRAAADGRVVYSGSGLLGYGQLLIIKHNETYLSAYGHTRSVVVHEGDVVRAGQRVATMGQGPQGTPLLYFEIRVNGSPTNPLALLPQR